MPYWNTPKNASVNLDSNTIFNNPSQKRVEFYEMEPAVVLDIILDKSHKYFQEFPQHTLNPTQWPPDKNGNLAKSKDLDYTWVGRALVRLYYSQQMSEKEDLIWAYPLESNILEYPLLNEIVGIIQYLGKYYYTRKINMFNLPNVNADFSIEQSIGGFSANRLSPIQGNRELILDSNPNVSLQSYIGPQSKFTKQGNQGYQGVLGRYFLFNKNIRSLKHREGDLVIESRFGQSIRFGAYDDDRKNDKGYNSVFGGYTDYKGIGNKYTDLNGKMQEAGGGNPMVLIRNRQRPLTDNADEKNVGGYMIEDINNDGSSIHMTSGVTPSLFLTTCYKKMWGTGEEQPSFQPRGSTFFIYPSPAIGDQIVMNSDRIVISAKSAEMFQFAKKRIAFVTDGEFTVDAHNQIVITTNNKTVINSPAIYLGEYNVTDEPILLGQTSVNWLYDLCEWLLSHTHWYTHTHPDAQGGTTGGPQADKTQVTVQAESLKTLRDKLDILMSRRVFTTGGGFAPGKNGGNITDSVSPVSIGILSGTGVPGGWKGQDKR